MGYNSGFKGLNKSYKARRATKMGCSFLWISSKSATFNAKLFIMLNCSNASRTQRKHKLPAVSNFHVWQSNLKVTKPGFIFLTYVRVQTETGPAHAQSNHANTARGLHRDERAHMHRYAGSFLRRVIINLLKTKRRLLYLKTQSVPSCKHFSSRL